MPNFCPAFPAPRKTRLPAWRAFFSSSHSWLDLLFEKSYAMQMGQVSLINSTLFMPNEPACVRHVLVDNISNYPKHDLLADALGPLLGESIFTTNGAQWQRQRQMMNPSFAQARIQVAFGHMQQATDAMMARLLQADLSHSQNMQNMQDVQDVQEEMTLVTADVIFRTIFSAGIDTDSAKTIFAAFTEYQALSPRLTIPAVYGLKWLTPFWLRKRCNRAARDIRQSLLALIEPRFNDRDNPARQTPANDILESLLHAKDDVTGERFSREELLNQVAMLFLAGHETSASALSWSLHLLANSPDIQARMHSEVTAIAADQPLQPQHLKSLELTWNVFRETLRLFPPVGFFARSVAGADTMRDKTLKKGDSVVIAPWLIHRHRQLWSQPDAFDPDRFTRPEGKASARDAYLPFSAGPRVCIGAAFAHQEAALILANIVRTYRLAPLAGHVPAPVGRLTIRSANGIFVQFIKR